MRCAQLRENDNWLSVYLKLSRSKNGKDQPHARQRRSSEVKSNQNVFCKRPSLGGSGRSNPDRQPPAISTNRTFVLPGIVTKTWLLQGPNYNYFSHSLLRKLEVPPLLHIATYHQHYTARTYRNLFYTCTRTVRNRS